MNRFEIWERDNLTQFCQDCYGKLQDQERKIERSAKAVDAGVSQPDLWALAKLVKDML